MASPIERMFSAVTRRIKLMISRGVVKRVRNSPKMQAVQAEMLANEVRDQLEHFEPYGFTHYPFAESECIVASIGGDRSHGVVLAIGDRRYRLTTLDEGEVALYDDQGSVVHLERNNKITIETGDSKCKAVLDGDQNKIEAVCDDKAKLTLDGANDTAKIESSQGHVTIDGDQKTITVDSGPGACTMTVEDDRVVVETTLGNKLSVLPGGTLIEADAATFIQIAPGVITLKAALINMLP